MDELHLSCSLPIFFGLITLQQLLADREPGALIGLTGTAPSLSLACWRLSDMGVCCELQELGHIMTLPSLPRLASLHSLPSFVPACLIEDTLSSPDTAAVVSEHAARDEQLLMPEQPALARQTEGRTAALAAAEGHLLAVDTDSIQTPPDQVMSETKSLSETEIIKHCTAYGGQSGLASILSSHLQDLGLPAMQEGPASKSATALQHATKRRRLACGSSSDGGSNWEPGAPAFCAQRAKAGRQAKRGLPAVQGAVLRNRMAQRRYLRRKKVSRSQARYTSYPHGCGPLLKSLRPPKVPAQSHTGYL